MRDTDVLMYVLVSAPDDGYGGPLLAEARRVIPGVDDLPSGTTSWETFDRALACMEHLYRTNPAYEHVQIAKADSHGNLEHVSCDERKAIEKALGRDRNELEEEVLTR